MDQISDTGRAGDEANKIIDNVRVRVKQCSLPAVHGCAYLD